MREVKISLGFTVEVNEDDGRFCLPDRTYSTSDLKKIAREVNRAQRKSLAAAELEETECDYDE